MMTSAVTSAIRRKLQRKPAVGSGRSVVSLKETSYWTVKPALTNKEFSSWTFSKANPTADDLAKQFQQQRKIQQRRRLHLLHVKKSTFLDAKQGCCTESFTVESRGDSSRVQGRLHAVTADLED
ncbi:hypothetical protein F511_30149 [Dorcoceras hygrometricum]|uniref:Uncharacterized protein n=1 Tax=Dorcoceras hygrometricum TaxID=472368 RepID=A0A2Z7AGC4_9LAMI|nr:hypothetical protein F511_30149 [Dorcoceras hygrometricum]